MQIKQDENRTGLFVKCKDSLQFVDNPTTKEAILINELQKNGDAHKEDGGYGIYDIRAEYDPEFDLQYLDACKKEFSRIFSEGNRLKEIPHILQKLDGLVEEHKYDEFEDRGGNIRFLTESIWGIRNCTRGELPFDEIWTEFYVKEIKDYETCFLLDFYLDFWIGIAEPIALAAEGKRREAALAFRPFFDEYGKREVYHQTCYDHFNVGAGYAGRYFYMRSGGGNNTPEN